MGKAILSEGYGLMPNVILFDSDLSSTAKLIMCHLMSLAAADGFCRPRNKYLAEKFNLKPRQVTNILQELGLYISIGEDQNGRRIISLAPELTEERGGSKKLLGGTQKIAIHSNINSNKKVYTSETLASIEKVYKVWLIYMVIAPELRLEESKELRSHALEAAKKRCKLTPKRRDAIARRLEDAGEKMLVRAVAGISQSPFHRDGLRDDGVQGSWKADIEFLCRSYEKVEEWANKYRKEEE